MRTKTRSVTTAFTWIAALFVSLASVACEEEKKMPVEEDNPEPWEVHGTYVYEFLKTGVTETWSIVQTDEFELEVTVKTEDSSGGCETQSFSASIDEVQGVAFGTLNGTDVILLDIGAGRLGISSDLFNSQVLRIRVNEEVEIPNLTCPPPPPPPGGGAFHGTWRRSGDEDVVDEVLSIVQAADNTLTATRKQIFTADEACVIYDGYKADVDDADPNVASGTAFNLSLLMQVVEDELHVTVGGHTITYVRESEDAIGLTCP